MVSKLSSEPQSPRNVLNVYAYLLSGPFAEGAGTTSPAEPPSDDPETCYLSESEYVSRRTLLLETEARVLRVLGFDTHVALPYTLAINYLQTLDVFKPSAAAAGPSPSTSVTGSSPSAVAKRAFAHLTTMLLSPQQVYLTHQPPALATAAIYLSARELGWKLPAGEWWSVFDVDREELGFLVVAMLSVAGFAAAEKEKWSGTAVADAGTRPPAPDEVRGPPLSAEGVEREVQRRRTEGVEDGPGR